MIRIASLWAFFVAGAASAAPPPLKLLFLGDDGHHQPSIRYRQWRPFLESRGLATTYTDRVADLNPQTLAGYDGVILYANIDVLPADAEKALLDYVASGKGFIPLHCASFCFRNSDAFVKLVGGQFQRHGTGVFRTRKADLAHPILAGFGGFESWDETYVHTKHNDADRTVLEYRIDKDGSEPYTWTRTQGKGRVFYTAWGHDERTWMNPGFQNLVERGIRWACGQDAALAGAFAEGPTMAPLPTGLAKFEYEPAVVPFYPPGERWGTIAEPIKQRQKPIPAAESLKHYQHPVGFSLKLFADEEMLQAKPIAMAWDHRGRLWVCETVDYPNDLQPPGQGHDRIRILEDTDGDGVADKSTIFADKLSVPTSLCFANGGVIVTAMPDTLFLKDTDGDDKCDERKVLFTGWGTGDTHAGPSNLRYGLDNWIYGMVGYSSFNGEVGGERHRFGSGFFRFRPDGSKMEFLRSTSNNSWGVGFNEEGALFGSTANGNPSMHLGIPNRFYEQVRGWAARGPLPMVSESARFAKPIRPVVRQVDWHGMYTAGAGHSFYTARTYPKEYWNRIAFVNEPTAGIVGAFEVAESGADYRTKNAWNLLSSDDDWAAPIFAEVGPDGNVWVIDWYAFIVQHNPTPAGYKTGKRGAYETPLRDHRRGRIYRLVHDQGTPSETTTLKDAAPAQLVAALKSTNQLWRLHAQRLLVERGKDDVVPALVALAKDQSRDEIGLNAGALHALWALAGLNALADGSPAAEAVVAALKHPSAGVRRNAAAALPRTAAMRQALLASGALADPVGQVQLAAALALAEMPPGADGGKAALDGLADPLRGGDPMMAEALASAAARHDGGFLAAAVSLPAGKAKPGVLEAVQVVAEHAARSGAADSVAILGRLGGSESPYVGAIVQGFAKGWPKTATAKVEIPDAALQALFGKLQGADRTALMVLGGRLGLTGLEQYSAELVAGLMKTALDGAAADNARIGAARQLVELRPNDAKSAAKLLGAVTPQTPPAVAAGVLEALGTSVAPELGAEIAKSWPQLTPAARPPALRALVARAAWTPALLDAVEARTVGWGDLALDQKQSLANHADPGLRRRAAALLKSGGGLPDANRQKVVEEFAGLAKQTGDAANGKKIYVKVCGVCHKHGTEGGNVGPDLTGMAVHPKEEMLIHILDPSRSVEGNYRAYTVRLADGRTLTGLIASETKSAVELVDAQAKRHSLQREDIEALKASDKSLMPEGFEKQVTRQELSDVLEFLAKRGKYTPLDLSKVASACSTRGMFYSRENRGEAMNFRNWDAKTYGGIPFKLIDPQGDKFPNLVMLHGPVGEVSRTMPKAVELPCYGTAKALHFLTGMSGWGYPAGEKGTVSMIVRLTYADGAVEDHPLKNGIHFADYVRKIDVPESHFAQMVGGHQVRWLTVVPKRSAPLKTVTLEKGRDQSAPMVFAATVEAPE